MTKSGAEKVLDLTRYGFWVRTKLAPFRAVRWEEQRHEDGRQSYRGKNWVEVLPHGEDREPERFFTADVETAGPHEWLEYYPAVREPVCGWGQPRMPHGKTLFCPAARRGDDAFCPKHMAVLNEERNLDGAQEPGTGGEPVPPPE